MLPRRLSRSLTIRRQNDSAAQSLALLWLVGLSLRVTVLAVPPLLLKIREELALDGAQIAALTTLPLLLFCVAATLGSKFVAVVGARRTLIAGLVVAAGASALRGASPTVTSLFAFTLLMGLGIAAVQPAVPVLVQVWAPGKIDRATAAYVNGILVAEAAAASLTLPVLLPALGSWESALAVWAVPLAITAVCVAFLTRDTDTSAPAERWVPAWSEARTWYLGALMGAGSVAYFASNAMLPVYLDARHLGHLVGWSLAALNTSQLAASVAIAALPRGVGSSPVILVGNGVVILGGTIFLSLIPSLAVLWAGLIGFSAALIFIVSLTLPAALAKGGETARLAAGMMTIGYGAAFALPLLGGTLLDVSTVAWVGLIPVGLAGVTAVFVASIAESTAATSARRK